MAYEGQQDPADSATESSASPPLDSASGSETVVPLLPCVSIDPTIEFYRALGFVVTDEMRTPYVYLALAFGGFEVHMGPAPHGLDPAVEQSGGCLVMVDQVAPYHAAFRVGLKRSFGKVLSSGVPRITRLRPDASRFTVIDPSGNALVFIQRGPPENVEYGGAKTLSGLAKALDNAHNLRDFKNDDRAAFRALTSGLRRHSAGATRMDLARAMAAQLELVPALGEHDRVPEIVAALRELDLAADERATIMAELATEHIELDSWIADLEAGRAET